MIKKIILLLVVLLSSKIWAQKTEYKEYSYSQFFKLIEKEKDTVFKLQDALIKYNPKTDQRFVMAGIHVYEAKDSAYTYKNDIVITKPIELDNVQFLTTTFRTAGVRTKGGVLLDIHFKNKVTLNNTTTLFMRYCRFEEAFDLDVRDCNPDSYISDVFDSGIEIAYSKFKGFNHYIYCNQGSQKIAVEYRDNEFSSTNYQDRFLIANSDVRGFYFDKNSVNYLRDIFIGIFGTSYGIVSNNSFKSEYIQHNLNSIDNFRWFDNTYHTTVFLTQNPFSSNDQIGIRQFKKGISEYSGLMNYSLKATNKYPVHLTTTRKALLTKYLDSVRFYNEKAFSEEMSLKGQFYNYFKSRYNTQIANQVYIDLKDFETQRLRVIHDQNPGFRSYFKWKVNQFLKLFSDYGTEPSKAIVVSVYVILFFAFIYLLFPNTWDRHGKNRIMNRYRFFTKYMKKDAGMHEVFLEEQEEELLESEDFKHYMLAADKTIPSFFLKTALPLYKWSISSTKFSASLLRRVDVMQGTWSDLPDKKRTWKSILLIGAFCVALLYDLFIKVLNALMLSINTFTTLGFGEIPIKGLPRYLAIIQGFIGWFMLTIFSVSLISQLLN